jgi:hypothetical protein
MGCPKGAQKVPKGIEIGGEKAEWIELGRKGVIEAKSLIINGLRFK